MHDQGYDVETKAKHVLLQRLGLVKDDAPMDEATLSKYAALFDRPLAADVIQAFADLYGWGIPSAECSSSPQRTGSPHFMEV